AEYPDASVDLHAGVPPERADQRHTAIEARGAHRVPHQPAQTPLLEQFVGARRQRIGPKRREVLVGQRIPDQRVVVRVGAPAERAERWWNPADLDVEVASGPRPDTRE